MMDLMRKIRDSKKGEDGASALEYALLIALIAAVIVVAVFILGNFIRGTFSNTCTAIQSEGAPGNTSAIGSCSTS